MKLVFSLVTKINESDRAMVILNLESAHPVEKQVRRVYCDLVKIHHPDKGDSIEKMQEITDAYDSVNKEKKIVRFKSILLAILI